MTTDIKQVIIIRKDLNMRRGKEIAQGSHASNGWLIERIRHPKYPVIDCGQLENLNWALMECRLHWDEIWWLENGTKKITLQVDSEAELLDLYNKSKEAKLNTHLVQDWGLTEFDGVKTYTCVAIGPNKSEEIDKITKDLKLY